MAAANTVLNKTYYFLVFSEIILNSEKFTDEGLLTAERRHSLSCLFASTVTLPVYCPLPMFRHMKTCLLYNVKRRHVLGRILSVLRYKKSETMRLLYYYYFSFLFIRFLSPFFPRSLSLHLSSWVSRSRLLLPIFFYITFYTLWCIWIV